MSDLSMTLNVQMECPARNREMVLDSTTFFLLLPDIAIACILDFRF